MRVLGSAPSIRCIWTRPNLRSFLQETSGASAKTRSDFIVEAVTHTQEVKDGGLHSVEIANDLETTLFFWVREWEGDLEGRREHC